MEELVSYVKEFLFTIKDEIQVTDDMINNIQVLNWKYENGLRCEDKGPILYSKLLINKRSSKIMTTFYDETSGDEMNPLDIINIKGTVRTALKIENIVIGKKIIIQMKLYEVLYRKIMPRVEKPYVKKSLLNPDITLERNRQLPNHEQSRENLV